MSGVNTNYCWHEGILWNFAGSKNVHWHRDGRMRAINAFVAIANYSSEEGWPIIRPRTHRLVDPVRWSWIMMPVAVTVELRAGEALLFDYFALHASTPNFGTRDRKMMYMTYSAGGKLDTGNHNSHHRSLRD